MTSSYDVLAAIHVECVPLDEAGGLAEQLAA
jgi:hypothetical protein